MKQIELKSVKFPDDSDFSYKEAIQIILARPGNPQAGANYEEMRKVLPILDKVDAANGVLVLEDAEHTELMNRAKNMPYRVINKTILDFLDSIVTARAPE